MHIIEIELQQFCHEHPLIVFNENERIFGFVMIAKNQYWVLAEFNIKLQMVLPSKSYAEVPHELHQPLHSKVNILLFSLTNGYILTMKYMANAKFATNLMKNTLTINPSQL